MTPLEFSAYGDRLFGTLADRFTNAHRWRLLVEQPLPWERLESIRHAAMAYIGACVGKPVKDESSLMLYLSRANLANLTPNGLLVPKREFVLEFNLFQRAVGRIFEDFNLGGLVSAVHIPATLRIVNGLTDDARDARPKATSKMHSDVWAGEPLDAVVVHLPLFGDPENIGIEFAEMPPDREQEFMRVMEEYDEGAWLKPFHYDCVMRSGNVYFADSRLLHRTVRHKPGVRVSVDFRFRLPSQGEYREKSDAILEGGRAVNYVSYERFKAITNGSIIMFDKSVKEPASGYGTEFRTVDL